jgi:hypothetical protein
MSQCSCTFVVHALRYICSRLSLFIFTCTAFVLRPYVFCVVLFRPMYIGMVLLSMLFLCAPLACMFPSSCCSRLYVTLIIIITNFSSGLKRDSYSRRQQSSWSPPWEPQSLYFSNCGFYLFAGTELLKWNAYGVEDQETSWRRKLIFFSKLNLTLKKLLSTQEVVYELN